MCVMHVCMAVWLWFGTCVAVSLVANSSKKREGRGGRVW